MILRNPNILVKSISGFFMKKIFVTILLLSMYFVGQAIGYFTSCDEKVNAGKILTAENWGLGFGAEGSKPTGNVSAEELKQYNAYYVGETEEKVIYLTFDCGYENGNTEPILDALKKHNVKATFFVVGHFLESAPEIVKRIVEDGHTVGNHTYHHLDMSKISDEASFRKETEDVETLFESITGTKMEKYYRPPQGKYSTANMEMANKMGYQTFFWSLAYVDWYQDKQPTHEEAFEKLTGRIHPGAIVLLHSTSRTNGEILDELLTKWEEMGYTIKPLSEITNQNSMNQNPTDSNPGDNQSDSPVSMTTSASVISLPCRRSSITLTRLQARS